MLQRPDPTEYAPPFARYIDKVAGSDILQALAEQGERFAAVIAAIPEDRAGYRYAEGKWAIRDVVGHVIDGERVFAWRALAIARGETQPLPGFEENEYMEASTFDRYTLAELVAEFQAVRFANRSLFGHLDEVAWKRAGTVNETPASVTALAWVIAGHCEHHLGVLRERYGIGG